jgi:MFS family permease
MTDSTAKVKNPINMIVVVAALGYFVDTYDLILFNALRIPSLKALKVADGDIRQLGQHLLNLQMIGMVIGGVLWGILGDRKGRLSVLFGSIFLYSAANIANAYVSNIEAYGWMSAIEAYGWLRLLAGIGLAGELGAGITLVSEIMTKEKRGLGTMLVVSFGVMGAVTAGAMGHSSVSWEKAYIVGGLMGLVLLILRIGVYESGMYVTLKEKNISKGNFFQLFSSRERFFRYLNCISIGLPIWFVVGILITLVPELAVIFGVKEPVSAGTAIMYFYIGAVAGDFTSGYLSQYFKNRRKIIFIYMTLTALCSAFYLLSHEITIGYLYAMIIILGLFTGYWAVFVSMSSEQFGTNLRSTVTTSVPNFVRGGIVPISMAFNFFIPYAGIIKSALIVGGITFSLAYLSLWKLTETFGRDLDFIEPDQ